MPALTPFPFPCGNSARATGCKNWFARDDVSLHRVVPIATGRIFCPCFSAMSLRPAMNVGNNPARPASTRFVKALMTSSPKCLLWATSFSSDGCVLRMPGFVEDFFPSHALTNAGSVFSMEVVVPRVLRVCMTSSMPARSSYVG